MYPVGYTTSIALDRRRKAWRSESARPVRWSAWYPAADGTVTGESIFDQEQHSLFKAGPVARNAVVSSAKARWPVVLLSHGTGGSAEGLCWLAGRLAANGFVVIGVSHHGNTSHEPFLPEGFLCWWERASDISFILDELSQHGPLAQRLETGEVYGVGFSLGAHTMLALAGAVTHMPLFESWASGSGRLASGPREFPQLADELERLSATSNQFRESWERQGHIYQDARLRSLVLLAPAPPVRALRSESVAAIRVPAKVIAAGGDQEAPAADCALWLAGLNPEVRLEMLGDDVGHYAFLPEATSLGMRLEPVLCIDAPGISRRTIHDQVAEACIAAFGNS